MAHITPDSVVPTASDNLLWLRWGNYSKWHHMTASDRDWTYSKYLKIAPAVGSRKGDDAI